MAPSQLWTRQLLVDLEWEGVTSKDFGSFSFTLDVCLMFKEFHDGLN